MPKNVNINIKFDFVAKLDIVVVDSSVDFSVFVSVVGFSTESWVDVSVFSTVIDSSLLISVSLICIYQFNILYCVIFFTVKQTVCGRRNNIIGVIYRFYYSIVKM